MSRQDLKVWGDKREGRAVAVWGRPVSGALYKEQRRKILGMAGEIEEFIKKNESLLKTKE